MLQQRMNVFDKPCKQNDACINFAVARKRGAKLNISTLLPLQSKATDSSLATKGMQESFGSFCYVHTTTSMNIAVRDWYSNTFQRTSPKRESDWTA